MPDRTASAETDVELLRRQRAVLARFGQHALRVDDLDVLLQEATELVSDAIGVKLVKVLQLLPGREMMLVRAGVNWKPGVVGHATFGADSHSPAGYALTTDQPVISPEVAREDRFAIPDLLREHGVKSMVNVVIRGSGPPWGVLEVDSPKDRTFDEDDVAFLQIYANLLAAAIERQRVHREVEQAAQRSDLLLGELHHRVQNLLANIQAMARRTLATSTSLEEFAAAFEARLGALARTQDLLTRRVGASIDLRDVLDRELEAHGAARAGRVSVEGPRVAMPPDTAQALGMAFHELSTNASKYGALGRDGATLQVAWQRETGADGEVIRVVWRERGVPIAGEPTRKGFGTEVLERALPHLLGGGCTRTFHPDGFECIIRFRANDGPN